MGYVDRGDADLFLELLELHAHDVAQALVQIGQRLVEQQDIGLVDDDPRQGHALALAARELGRIAVAELGQLHQVERRLDALLALGLGHIPGPQPELHIAPHRHVGEQGVTLEHHADIALVHRHVVHDPAADRDFTGGRGFIAPDHPERGGLPAAAGSDQEQKLAVIDLEGNVVDGDVVAEGLGDILDLQNGLAHDFFCARRCFADGLLQLHWNPLTRLNLGLARQTAWCSVNETPGG